MSPYHEIVIGGSYDLTRGFVTGYLTGRAFPVPAVFSRECGIRRVTLGERMLSWTGVHEPGVHVIVEEGIAADLIREVRSAAETLGLRVLTDRRIGAGRFEFRFHVYGRVYGGEIKEILASVPPGVEVRYARGPEEKSRPRSRGVELYAPEHDYEFTAEAAAEGPFGDILPFFQRLADHPLVETGELHLEYGD